jgi:MFS transporter, DHA1 family, multidrug resistance protein
VTARTHPTTRTAGSAPVPGAPAGAGVPGRLLLTLGLLAAFAPFAMDMYLPALPEMTTDLGTSAVGVQLSLTAFLVGAAAGQLVFGPVSDRYGRRRPLLIGGALCVLASAATVVAPGLAALVAARLVQGIAGAAGMVIGRAVISDLTRGRAAARAFSLLMLVGSAAPVVAPFLGSVLVARIGWRGVLGVVLALALVGLAASAVVVPESRPAGSRGAARDAGPWAVVLTPGYVLWTSAVCLSFGALMAFIAGSPFLFQVTMGLSPVRYGLLFGGIALLLVIAGAVAARLVAVVAPVRMVTWGIAVMTAASLVLALLVAVDVPSLWFAVPLAVVVPGLGLVMGNGTALALGAVPHATGKGSAVLGAVQFGIAALVAPLVGVGGGRSAAPLAAVLVTTTALASVACLLARRSTPAAS